MSTLMMRFYKFGPFCVDTEKRLLLREGEVEPLAPKAFDTLLVLVQHHGEVLEKDVLMGMLWPDSDVEEANLPQNISALRKALGESPNERRYIVTIPGRGYRFAADVEELDYEISDLVVGKYTKSTLVIQESAPDTANKFLLAPGFFRSHYNFVLASLTALALIASGFWLLFSRKSESQRSVTAMKSIAVLPFKPLVADHRDESLEMGMADSLIIRLSGLRGVSVQSLGSVRRFSGLEQDALKAGRELDVESVLDGQIQRWGDRVRLTARLIGVGDGRQLWSGQFDERFTDIFTVQDLISERVASALALELTGEEKRRLTKHYTENAEAYQLYVTGRFYWETRTEEGLRKAIENFEEAIDKDPNYALAHAGLADSHILLGIFGFLTPNEAFPKAKAATLAALSIDDQLAEAHTALGHIKAQYEYDGAGAEREFRRAIELNPNYAFAHFVYGNRLSATGRFDEGIAEIKRAQELEPLSLVTHANLGVILYNARRYDEAINQLKRVLEMNPNLDHARSWLGRVYLQVGMNDQAIAEFQRRKTLAPASPGVLGQAYAMSGRRSEALKEIETLRQTSKQHYVPAYNLALIYSGLDDKEKACEWLEKAYEERSTHLIWINVDPALDRLRSDPRFKAIIKRMGLE